MSGVGDTGLSHMREPSYFYFVVHVFDHHCQGYPHSKWLLQLQPSHFHSTKQDKRKKKGCVLSLKNTSQRLFIWLLPTSHWAALSPLARANYKLAAFFLGWSYSQIKIRNHTTTNEEENEYWRTTSSLPQMSVSFPIVQPSSERSVRTLCISTPIVNRFHILPYWAPVSFSNSIYMMTVKIRRLVYSSYRKHPEKILHLPLRLST